MLVAVLCAKVTPHHEVRLCAFSRATGNHSAIAVEVADTQSDYMWPQSSESEGFRRVTLFRGSNYWSTSYPRVQNALTEALDRIRPDVVVIPGWAFRESWAGLLWAVRRGVPRVLVTDSQSIDNPQHYWRTWLKRRIVGQFQAALAGGRPHIEYLVQLGMRAECCFTGCDVVDNSLYAHIPPRFAPADGPATLVSSLRFIPAKNIFSVLDALAVARGRWRWVVAGYGSLEAAIRERIDALGLDRTVELLGAVDYFQMAGVYARGHVYLQPSISEPWGLAVNEAMASSTPVLVSNRCGCRHDLVRWSENGFQFDPADPFALPAALDTMWSVRAKWPAMGAASRQIVSAWCPDHYARNLWAACEAAAAAPAAVLRPRRWAGAIDMVCRNALLA